MDTICSTSNVIYEQHIVKKLLKLIFIMSKIFIKKREDGKYYWDLKDNNNRSILVGTDSKPMKAAAKLDAQEVKKNGANAPIDPIDKSGWHFETYEGGDGNNDGSYRFRLNDGNDIKGKSEGYKQKSSVEPAIENVKKELSYCTIESDSDNSHSDSLGASVAVSEMTKPYSPYN
jgi:uncharacterized protein YegP (UPF0339 family)